MGLFDPDARDRAVSRALMIGALLHDTDQAALVEGLGLATDESVRAELTPFANALYAARLAYRGISEGTRQLIADPRRDARVASAAALLDGAEKTRPIPFGGHVDAR